MFAANSNRDRHLELGNMAARVRIPGATALIADLKRKCVFIKTSLELSEANWYSGLKWLDILCVCVLGREKKTKTKNRGVQLRKGALEETENKKNHTYCTKEVYIYLPQMAEPPFTPYRINFRRHIKTSSSCFWETLS